MRKAMALIAGAAAVSIGALIITALALREFDVDLDDIDWG